MMVKQNKIHATKPQKLSASKCRAVRWLEYERRKSALPPMGDKEYQAAVAKIARDCRV